MGIGQWLRRLVLFIKVQGLGPSREGALGAWRVWAEPRLCLPHRPFILMVGMSFHRTFRPAGDETCGIVERPSAERSAIVMVRVSPRISWTRGTQSTPDCARDRKVRERAV